MFWKFKEYRSEEEILFSGRTDPYLRERDPDDDGGGTTFAGTGPVCSGSLTPDPAKAARLRTQKYW